MSEQEKSGLVTGRHYLSYHTRTMAVLTMVLLVSWYITHKACSMVACRYMSCRSALSSSATLVGQVMGNESFYGIRSQRGNCGLLRTSAALERRELVDPRHSWWKVVKQHVSHKHGSCCAEMVKCPMNRGQITHWEVTKQGGGHNNHYYDLPPKEITNADRRQCL